LSEIFSVKCKLLLDQLVPSLVLMQIILEILNGKLARSA